MYKIEPIHEKGIYQIMFTSGVNRLNTSLTGLNDFIEGLNSPVFLLSEEADIIAYNHAVLSFYKLQATDVMQQNYFIFCKNNNLEPAFPSIEIMCSNDLQKKNNHRFIPPAKTIHWESSFFVTDQKDKIIFLFGTDIAYLVDESTKSSILRNSIIDFLPNHYIFWKDINSVYLGCNATFAKEFGLSSNDEIVGHTDYDLPTTKKESDAYRADDREVMQSGLPKLNIEECQTLPNAEERILSTSKMPLFDEKGKIYGVLAIYTDITERKKLELSLAKAKEAAEAANHAKTEFIANMSHDLRTPLSGIVGMSQLLKDLVADQEQKQYVEWVHESGKQLLDLLNGILDVVSAENINEMDIHLESFNLRQCIQDIVHLELPTVRLKNLELITQIDDNIPLYLLGDRTKLHRILLNLIGNAIKFTKRGAITVDIQLLNEEENRVNLNFRVIDTGIGLSEDLQQKIFDRFFRASPSYKGMYSGHGIGLNIAQSFVRLLGGEIKVSSQERVGTTFQFNLPFEKTEKQGNDPVLTQDFTDTFSHPIVNNDINDSSRTPSLLLVEDNSIARRMIELFAIKANCNFMSAVDGEQALQLVRQNNFDLIITDVGLPGISGRKLTEAIRKWEITESREPIAIIGLTAHVNRQLKEDCIRDGMNAVFTKPLDIKTLQIIIRQYVANKEQIFGLSSEKPLGLDLPTSKEELFELAQYPLFDFSSAINQVGNEAMLHDLLSIMVHQEIPKIVLELQQAFEEKNWELIEKLAHKMKGGASYCGTVRLRLACQYIERYRKAGYYDLLERLYYQLMQIIHETKYHIESKMNKTSALL